MPLEVVTSVVVLCVVGLRWNQNDQLGVEVVVTNPMDDNDGR